MDESLQRLRKLPLDQAALEAYYLGDQMLRQLVFDPLLPSPLVKVALRQTFRDVMRHYDEAGHQVWRDFLASAG